MHTILALAVVGRSIVLLYQWLVCHWFSRVLMFLLFSACLLGFFFPAGFLVAWLLASIPIYVQRMRARNAVHPILGWRYDGGERIAGRRTAA
jgi:hypothetical protein